MFLKVACMSSHEIPLGKQVTCDWFQSLGGHSIAPKMLDWRHCSCSPTVNPLN